MHKFLKLTHQTVTGTLAATVLASAAMLSIPAEADTWRYAFEEALEEVQKNIGSC